MNKNGSRLLDNRKQKIIVSITGIFLVLMILVGLTYAYFLTKITGNTNTKSISVSTANLELVYGDGTTQILKNDTPLEPSSDAIGTKDFTVTNNGNSKTSYVVVIEDVVIKNTTDDTTTTFNSNDFRYTLTCTKKDGTTCDGVITQSVFPITGGIMVGNSIDVDDVQSYILTLWYIDTGIDQSKDMGKSLQAKINIKDITQVTNPYSSNKNSLAYNIIENAKNKSNGTELLSSPKTQVAEEISQFETENFEYEFVKTDSLCAGYNPWMVGDSALLAQTGNLVNSYDEAVGKYVYDQCSSWIKYLESYDASSSTLKFKTEIMKSEVSISVAPDDYGISYYYRGAVEDNYVNFAGMCWKIVRIAGDGSIKLILEDKNTTCDSNTYSGEWAIGLGNFGYTDYAPNTLIASDGTKNTTTKSVMNYLNGGTNNDESMSTSFENFQTSLSSEIESGKTLSYYLKAGDWCLDDKAYANNASTTPLTSQEILDNQIKGTTFYYDSYVRLNEKTIKEPTLKCNGTNMNKFLDNSDMYVGALSVDEVLYAGGAIAITNSNYYLINDHYKGTTLSLGFLLFSPEMTTGSSDTVYFVETYSSNISSTYVSQPQVYLRPAINLKSNVQINGGSGTKENPYIVQ